MLRMDTERIWDSGRVIQDSVWRGLHSYGPGAFSLFYIQRIGSYQYKSDLDIGKKKKKKREKRKKPKRRKKRKEGRI